jgi:hypothetical protein
MVHIETKYLDSHVLTLDQQFEKHEISQAEYIQIGLLLKIYESILRLVEDIEKAE